MRMLIAAAFVVVAAAAIVVAIDTDDLVARDCTVTNTCP